MKDVSISRFVAANMSPRQSKVLRQKAHLMHVTYAATNLAPECLLAFLKNSKSEETLCYERCTRRIINASLFHF